MFKPTKMKEGLEGLQEACEKLCFRKLEEASKNKTPDWTIKDVTCALKSLKTGKSKDPYEMPNELFRPQVAGTDLILVMTKLMNKIKTNTQTNSKTGTKTKTKKKAKKSNPN